MGAKTNVWKCVCVCVCQIFSGSNCQSKIRYKTFLFCFVDDVPFGEVTMAPPSLSAKPKKAPVKSQVIGSYHIWCRWSEWFRKWLTLSPISVIQKASKELLLNSLLGHTVASTTKPSMARQRIMEEERERAVEAYRLLKKQRQQQHEARTAGVEKLKNLKWCFMSKNQSAGKFRNWDDMLTVSGLCVLLELIRQWMSLPQCS